ncbi:MULTISPECIES: polysaccharide biosynthesis C-terminal domain-containing protein [unclassified Microbacterium]|uniref:polysaccharide biosynthesis C-terminal domain-containing protein n=1 Tax=unclassified Microbacterium TaxID=2609290 RepID=UPI001F0F86A6|nr:MULTISPECIES: capsular biosynthesis protein [unclassified Microbacterium]
MTGANGFLGWHTRLALRARALDAAAFTVGSGYDGDRAARAISGSARAIHIAGVNRASDHEVSEGNLLFATQFADALRRAEEPPPVIAYANSTQSANASIYGEAKLRAGEIVRKAAEDVGAAFEDVVLPNIFGEHGQPFYNAVTATFCHLLAEGEVPTIAQDKEMTLLHAQNAADLLSGGTQLVDQGAFEVHESVSGLLSKLQQIARTYARGEIPDVADPFDRDLFNTYRSYTFPAAAPIRLTRHADARGSFFEIIRAHGGSGQSSFSTTLPGISRGDHFHRRKIERFTVLAGEATISLRKMFTEDVIAFPVNGVEPAAVDMPVGWSHKIQNTGTETLYTSFWTNEIFDPEEPDTIAEAV